MGRIDVARGLVSASVVSRVVAVNSSHIKGSDGASASVHSIAAERFAKPRAVGTARLFGIPPTTFHSTQVERPSHRSSEQGFTKSHKDSRHGGRNIILCSGCLVRAFVVRLGLGWSSGLLWGFFVSTCHCLSARLRLGRGFAFAYTL
ncbi:hypothetical protein AVEN_125490-1 [Araneus ventricosus]|uniref:Uncharacterized protein n=1 Tax=Araneus ventricosus TaxID=182803 RepID=A0A4Y2NR45_ARAVE|nr:hypothetical protein AVEN_125490-1 [Araneus ventricosus]